MTDARGFSHIAAHMRSLLPFLLGVLLSVSASRAAVIVSIVEGADNVTITASGTLNLTSLSSTGPNSVTAFVNGGIDRFGLGELGSIPANNYEIAGASFDMNYGAYTPATSGSGIRFGIYIDGFWLDTTYVSGDLFTSTATFDGVSLSDLGFPLTIDSFTWGAGENADSISFMVSPASAIPEPSTYALVAGLLGFAVVAVRRFARGTAAQ